MTLPVQLKLADNPTLLDLINLLQADTTLPAAKRDDVISALRCLAKLLGQPIGVLAADPKKLRLLIAKFTPEMVKMTSGRWRNIRSLLQFALARAGLAIVPGSYRIPPSARWAALLKPLEYGQRYKLGHIARYCTAAGIEPEQVNDAVMERLLSDLVERSLAAEPKRVHRDAMVAWNQAVQAHPAWPQQTVTVPDNRHHYSLPWETFPASLLEEIEAWMDHLSGKNRFAARGFRPLRPASLVTRKKQLHEYLSALVIEGMPLEDMTSFADVATPECLSTGMMFFWNRTEGEPSVHAGQVASLIRSIAKHWVKLDQEALNAMKGTISEVAIIHSGMTERNTLKLLPLDDPDRKYRFYTITQKVVRNIISQPPTRSLAILMQTAICVEILTMMPMRLKNLQELQNDKHLIFGADRDDINIFIKLKDVKNRVTLDVRLPRSTGKMVNLYLETYRPLLDNPESSWLFAGMKPGTPKNAETLRQQIKSFLWTRLGLEFTPHTFRHAAAKFVLEENPGAYGQVQQMLGHKSIVTTQNFYTGTETKAATAHYNERILKYRDDETAIPKKGRR